jgi:transposase
MDNEKLINQLIKHYEDEPWAETHDILVEIIGKKELERRVTEIKEKRRAYMEAKYKELNKQLKQDENV